ncbi:hypothetical protein M8818_001961 [Zalaria obscura]|uniref:Uncharacterized protein n=1 Tax=Zalaria obscura TaxID=2024903 RepID=A0ACC3SJ81_9PEZI
MRRLCRRDCRSLYADFGAPLGRFDTPIQPFLPVRPIPLVLGISNGQTGTSRDPAILMPLAADTAVLLNLQWVWIPARPFHAARGQVCRVGMQQ